MTTLGRARILVASPADAPKGPPPLPAAPLVRAESHRRIARDVVLAREEAATIVAQARAEATAIVDAAKRSAETVAAEAAAEARQAEESKVAALYLCMKHLDETRAERDLDRVMQLGVVLSERLLGSALADDPELVIQIARQALAEARGTRRATIEASPLDADVLHRHLVGVGFPSHAVDIRTDPTLGRGSLRISTNLGTLDARLQPQLERLAKALRDTLRRA